jgi:ABC-2 type transport system permease protein
VRNILAIAAKDIRSQFVSPIAYVVLTGFLLLGGWFFFNLLARFSYLLQLYLSFRNPEAMQQLNLNDLVIGPLLHNLSVVLVILVPVITMRDSMTIGVLLVSGCARRCWHSSTPFIPGII